MIRPVTQNLIESFVNNEPLRPAARVDFGLDGDHAQDKWATLKRGYDLGIASPKRLDEALGNGKALTAIAHAVLDATNMTEHKDQMIFHTAWDDMEES
jgi:hypothetical protein